jgi:lysophospholipase L1-like esterase
LAVFTTALMLAVAELSARVVFPAPPDPTRQPQIVYRYDPEIRYVLAANQHGWIDDGFVTVNSNGFRGRETAIPKPPGRFRVVLVGDSVTFGWGVADDETFGARLEKLLHDQWSGAEIDVVNLAVGGYDTRQEVTLLERNLERLEPDLVLVGFYSNDVPEGLQDDNTWRDGGTRVLAKNPEPGQIMHLNPAPHSWWELQLRRSRAAYMAGRLVHRVSSRGEWGTSGFSMELDVLEGRDSAELTRAWSGVEAQFARLHALANHRFVAGVIALPCREQVMGQYPNARYQTRIREIAERTGLLMVDPLPALIASHQKPADLFIAYDRNHPSAAGHEIIARALLDGLASRRDLVAATHQ